MKVKRGKKNGRLVLAAKPDEIFVIFDEISRTEMSLKPFYRGTGDLCLAFQAPSNVRISRERQRGNAKNGNE